MRFAPSFLLAAVTCCSAQTVTVPNNVECMAARILTPSDAFPMPVAKMPDMQTMKGGVLSTRPACAQAAPKPLVVKRMQVKPGRFQLLPNPFTPLAK
jgi:hypothetical protein